MSLALLASRWGIRNHVHRALVLALSAGARWTLCHLGAANATCCLILSIILGLLVYLFAKELIVTVFNDETPISIDTDYMRQNVRILPCNEGNSQAGPIPTSNPLKNSDTTEQLVQADIRVEKGVSEENQVTQRAISTDDVTHQSPRHADSNEPNAHNKVDTLGGLVKVALWRQTPRVFSPGIAWANPNVNFPDEERMILDIFVPALRYYRHAFFSRFHRHFPRIRPFLVSITPSSQGLGAHRRTKCRTNTHICINGLSKLEDIRAFDKTLSGKRYKNICNPLRFCYEQNPITCSASSASYVVEPSSTGTLCGSLAIFRQSDGSRKKSTIGGLVEIHDEGIFALTTRHSPEDETNIESEKDVPCLADLMLSFYDESLDHLQQMPAPLPASSACSHEEDINEDEDEDGPEMEDFEGIEELSPRDLLLASWDGSSNGSVSSLARMDEIWDDWDLIPIEGAQRLPNFVPNAKSPEIKIGSKQITRIVPLDVIKFDNTLRLKVLIISGMSGVVRGLLSSNPSYLLCGIDSSHKVWTVRLEKGGMFCSEALFEL
ncbi:hypothetical protein CNYM01_09974 [Colletotrichum nymphaeae SA-01]|uniref:Uncharacterized protein n=1 Tax=Colletotrichum nymphaeae SA-01 TaxID=1460502 RepID=A0A135SWZ0_9PEZI|nr:hypothetical protein CNYM01_09974 [Colletotrichum nymphaeae SA-01]